MVRVPHGRGERRGTDAYIGQTESRNSRVREIPRRDEWMISPFRAYGSDQTSRTGHGQTLRLALLPWLEHGLEARFARLRVTTSNAGSYVRSCIYRLETDEGVRRFIQVPSTETIFLGDIYGVRTSELPGTATLRPGVRYFQGTYVSNASIGISSGANTAQRVVPVKTLSSGSLATKLPASVTVASMTNTFGLYVPWVVYMSSLAKEILT